MLIKSFEVELFPSKLIKDSNIDYLYPELKVAVIIPAYEEEKTIGETLKQIPRNISPFLEVIVVNDGSKDNTKEVILENNVTLIDFKENHGNGAAVRAGIEYCKDNNFDVLITLDADGQHDPKDIPKFIEPIINSDVEFVIGNRFDHFYNMNMSRKFFSRFMSFFYTILFRKKIVDPTNGYRSFKMNVFNDVELVEDYSTIQEILFKIMPKHKFQHIPIQVYERKYGKSFISYGKYFKRTMSALYKHYFKPRVVNIFKKKKKVLFPSSSQI